jgi:ribosome-associated translation inhibitor RaiA
LGTEDLQVPFAVLKPRFAVGIRTLNKTDYEKLTIGNMNIVVKYCGLTKRAVWEELVEKNLRKLQNLAAIATAQVTLEWQRGVKPAFRVLTHLEVPGPDFHAEASDHTVPAALVKVVKSLEKQIRSRKNRRADKWKTNMQLGLKPGRSSSGFAGVRA